MLVIRSEQLRAIADVLLEDNAMERAPRFFPGACEALGDGLRPFIRRAVERARRRGFTAQGEALQFVYLALIFGERFEEEQPWASRILRDNDPAKLPFRGSRLHEAAMRQLRVAERRSGRAQTV